MAFTSGPTALAQVLHAAQRRRRCIRRLRVQGDNGVLEIENPVSPHSGATLSIEAPDSPMPQIVSGGDTTFHYQLRHVLEVIEGRAQPLTGGDDAIGNMRAIDAVYRAAGLRRAA